MGFTHLPLRLPIPARESSADGSVHKVLLIVAIRGDDELTAGACVRHPALPIRRRVDRQRIFEVRIALPRRMRVFRNRNAQLVDEVGDLRRFESGEVDLEERAVHGDHVHHGLRLEEVLRHRADAYV